LIYISIIKLIVFTDNQKENLQEFPQISSMNMDESKAKVWISHQEMLKLRDQERLKLRDQEGLKLRDYISCRQMEVEWAEPNGHY
jgi:hypothetical protein